MVIAMKNQPEPSTQDVLAGLVERSAYREMFLNGQPPTLTEPEKGAGLEIATLLTEIRAIVEPEALLRKAG